MVTLQLRPLVLGGIFKAGDVDVSVLSASACCLEVPGGTPSKQTVMNYYDENTAFTCKTCKIHPRTDVLTSLLAQGGALRRLSLPLAAELAWAWAQARVEAHAGQRPRFVERIVHIPLLAHSPCCCHPNAQKNPPTIQMSPTLH